MSSAPSPQADFPNETTDLPAAPPPTPAEEPGTGAWQAPAAPEGSGTLHPPPLKAAPPPPVVATAPPPPADGTGTLPPPPVDGTADFSPPAGQGPLTVDQAPAADAAMLTTDQLPQPPDPALVATIDPPTPESPFVTQDHVSTPSAAPTGQRGGGATGAPLIGAYPPVAPQVRSGRYLLKKFHAKGGMGEIWLAEDCEIGRPVAMKKMRGRRPDQQERFLLEAQVTGQLEHPNIVPIHELGVDEQGQPFYVMKFIQGRTLKDVIDDYHAKVPPGGVPREVQGVRVLQIFLDVCQAVGYAHSRGVIHRDLKPDNVMVGAYGETLLLDWGLAKSVHIPEEPDGPTPVRLSHGDESFETLEGSIKGTPSYMAPEVAEGKVAEVDQASDIYLLGATLYEILTGQRPRVGKKVSELLELARNVAPTPPRKIDTTIPKALEAICLKAMARDKKERYASAMAVAEDVQRYLAGEPVLAYRENLWERAWRWIKRHRVAIGRTAAALLLLGVGLFAYGAVREAADLSAKDQAGKDVQAFRDLAEETKMYCAFQDPGTDFVPYVDLSKAEETGRGALAALASYGPALTNLPLPRERATVQGELYDLLVLLAQTKARRAAGADAVPAMTELLDRAAALHRPTASHHRVRAECWRLRGDKEKAAAEQARADDPRTSERALDHFLAGERLRTEHAREGRGAGEAKQSKATAEQLKAAVKEYRQALILDPQDYWAHFQIAHCYMALKQLDAAVEELGACIALRPGSPWGYSMRGLAKALQKREADALSDLDRAVVLRPEFRQSRLNRGLVQLLSKHYDAALKDFDAVLEPPEKDRMLDAAFYRGQLHEQLGQVDEALKDFSRVADAKGKSHPAFLHRARIRFARGEAKAGLADVDAFLGQGGAPGAAGLAKRGNQLRLLVRRLPEKAREPVLKLAAADLQKAVAGGARSPEAYDDLGAVLEDLSKLPQAIRAYDEAIKLARKDAALWVRRGSIRIALAGVDAAEYQRALADFTAALKIDPEHAEAYSWLGYVQACLGRSGGGTRQATQAVLHGAGDYMVLHNVACIYAKLSDLDLKRAQGSKAPALDPLRREIEKRSREYEGLAVDLLRREVALWRKDRAGPSPYGLIQGDDALVRVRELPEVRELLEGLLKDRP